MAVIQDPFHGLIDGILQGHAIATQLKHQAMQEEAFQQAKAKDQREAQVQDIHTRMMLQENARPVIGGAIQDGGLVRPPDKANLVKYKGLDGQPQDFELLSAIEQMNRRVALKHTEAFGSAQTSDIIHEYNLARHGVALPDDIADANGYPRGSKVLPAELEKLSANASTVRKNNRVDVAPGATVIDTTPERTAPAGPFAPIAAQRQQGQQDFVNNAKAAGGPKVLFTAPEKTDKPTGDFEKVFLPAFALKHGLTPDGLSKNPDLTMQAVQEYAQRTKDPETTRLAHELTQARLDQLRAQRSSTPMNIQAGTREFRVAQDLAYGRLTLQQFRTLYSSRNQEGNNKKLDIYDKAAELNPAFNPARFEMGFKFASSTKTQQQLSALDNVSAGASDLLKFSDAASRTGVTVLNKFIQKGGFALGGKTYSNFHTAQIAFADELSGALGFGGATDMSKKMGIDMTNPDLSPENFRSAVQEVVLPFIERKRKSMLDQMSVYGEPGMNPSAPKAEAPKQGGKISVTAPDGSVHPFDTQAQADAFKKLAGIK